MERAGHAVLRQRPDRPPPTAGQRFAGTFLEVVAVLWQVGVILVWVCLLLAASEEDLRSMAIAGVIATPGMYALGIVFRTFGQLIKGEISGDRFGRRILLKVV